MEKVLEVKNLSVSFDTYAGEVKAVRGVSFHLKKEETLVIVGESGSGKSVTIQSILQLLPSPPVRLVGGSILYNDTEISRYSDKQMEKIRGKEISMIFQDPMTSLNPTMKVGKQIIEGIKQHEKIDTKQAEKRVLQLLELVGIPNPHENINRFPHQFSGGMRQRVMIAIALACNSNILLADEPTTALDVTTQAQILELMNELKKKLGTAIILITHDMGVVAKMAQRIAVMYAGQIIETGTASDIFYNPKHPYTWGLLESIPSTVKGESKELKSIPGTPPDLISPPHGCAFAARCKYRMQICTEIHPPSFKEGIHEASCWLLDQNAPYVENPIKKKEAVERRGEEVVG